MTKKRFVWIVIILILGLGIAVFWLKPNPASDRPQFQTIAPTWGYLVEKVTSTGTIEARGTVEVGSQVSGMVASVVADYNTTVKKGQILAVLDKSLLQTQLQEAEAAVLKAETQLSQTQRSHQRNQQLFESSHLAQKEWELSRTQVKLDSASLLSTKAQLRKASINLEYAVIRSPIQGKVISRSIEPGQTVAASLSTPTLFVIAEDLSKMEILALVDESDIAQVKEGQHVEFTVQAYGEQLFYGTVRQIRLQPTMSSSIVNYTVVIDAANTEGKLLPGMTATVDFIISKQGPGWVLPKSALLFQPPFVKEKKNGIWISHPQTSPSFISCNTKGDDGVNVVLDCQGLKGSDTVIVSESATTQKKRKSLFSQPKSAGGPPPM